ICIVGRLRIWKMGVSTVCMSAIIPLSCVSERVRGLTCISRNPRYVRPGNRLFQSGWAGSSVACTYLPFTGQTPFMCSVLNTLRSNVPFGQTITYGELAELSGYPRAARAVGRCMAKNPWPVVIPCHRVVGCNSLGGFSSGPAIKKMLLDLEKQ
ncbi:MAG: methylated-DNA--[protein]-cysteine S-methyltransferase, partial [Desulfovibrionales bacterium]